MWFDIHLLRRLIHSHFQPITNTIEVSGSHLIFIVRPTYTTIPIIVRVIIGFSFLIRWGSY